MHQRGWILGHDRLKHSTVRPCGHSWQTLLHFFPAPSLLPPASIRIRFRVRHWISVPEQRSGTHQENQDDRHHRSRPAGRVFISPQFASLDPRPQSGTSLPMRRNQAAIAVVMTQSPPPFRGESTVMNCPHWPGFSNCDAWIVGPRPVHAIPFPNRTHETQIPPPLRAHRRRSICSLPCPVRIEHHLGRWRQ